MAFEAEYVPKNLKFRTKIVKNASILKKNVHKRRPETVDDLCTIAQEEFHKIPQTYVAKLYESIPRRLEQVVKYSGHPTKLYFGLRLLLFFA